MPWTTPGTATAGSVLTASFLNTNLRDNLNSVGVILLNTTTVSAAGTTTFDNVFSATYQAYEITYSGTTSGTNYAAFALRSGGVTTGGAGYKHRSAYMTAAAMAWLTGSSGTSSINVIQGDTTGLSYTIRVYRPFDTAPTRLDFYGERDAETQWGGGVHTASTSFDGFQISHGVDTATGTWRVYGLRNSF